MTPAVSLFPPPFGLTLESDPEPPTSGRLLLERGESALAVPRIAARRKKALVFMDAGEVWGFEADARLTFAHSAHGKLDIDVSLAEIEASPLGRTFIRVHRGWLANLALVKALEHSPGETQLFVGAKLGERSGIRVPVSRDRVRAVRTLLLDTAIGVRRRESAEDGRIPL
jgi:DNA-binding LytR/AlgR family response regulator